jgi:GNAT superfamily N-acetyltransferase
MDLVGSQLGVPESVRPGIVSTLGQPAWRFYFATSDQGPVAGAAMFVDGDGAWFGLAGTLPEYRHRGAQTALLARRIADAKAAACRWISAETSPETLGPNPSLRNMKRFGMRELYHRPWYRFHEDGSRPSSRT